jgi:hypothetical protein
MSSAPVKQSGGGRRQLCQDMEAVGNRRALQIKGVRPHLAPSLAARRRDPSGLADRERLTFNGRQDSQHDGECLYPCGHPIPSQPSSVLNSVNHHPYRSAWLRRLSLSSNVPLSQNGLESSAAHNS